MGRCALTYMCCWLLCVQIGNIPFVRTWGSMPKLAILSLYWHTMTKRALVSELTKWRRADPRQRLSRYFPGLVIKARLWGPQDFNWMNLSDTALVSFLLPFCCNKYFLFVLGFSEACLGVTFYPRRYLVCLVDLLFWQNTFLRHSFLSPSIQGFKNDSGLDHGI